MSSTPETMAVRSELANWVRDARERTFALAADLSDDQWMGPRLSVVNPMHWEVGHVAWFQEKWVLRHAAGRPPIRPDGDALYDSAAIPHEVRWDLPLPSRAQTLGYLQEVRDRVLERLERDDLSARDLYFMRLSVFHEDMHDEAFAYTRQTLAYAPPPPPPRADGVSQRAVTERPKHDLGDARIPGGRFVLGAERGEAFVFDNEKWAHPVDVAPFSIARCAVSQGEFARFVDDDGYRRADLWSPEGRAWLERERPAAPAYWRKDARGSWTRRHFDRWVPLEPDLAVIHVNAFEAEAYCRWAGRRLPTEIEWEAAAAGAPAAGGASLAPRKRPRPWGDAPPRAAHANLDGRALACVGVAAHPDGESAFGCRQMWGNAWEWTSTAFAPYPGFVRDPYEEYSEPWFRTHRVLRGGCWATRSRLLRNTWRNFYTSDRRDVWAGFRTCAIEPRPRARS